RAEFYDLRTTRVAYDLVELGNPLPDSATRVKEDYDHFQAVNTFRAEKEIRDWLFVSGGYLYSKLNADATFAVEAFTPSDPATALFTADGANPIVIRRESHIFNANTRVGPWDGLTVTAGLQNEWTHEEGFGRGLQ